MSFQDFNFQKKLTKAIEDIGFKEPSPIQKEAIPKILQGLDIVAQAHTGTGKTAAFGLPILNMLELNKSVEALIIVPTRELAMQVSDEIYRFGKYFGINTATVYGGSSYSRQIKHVNNSSVVVATPGRLIDLLSTHKIEINPKFVVLDEADEMLDMGFLDDIKEIFTYLSSQRQTLMFSATMPKQIKELAKSILYRPEFITITKSNITNKNIKQQFYVVEEHERDDALIRLIDFKNPTKSIIFCRMKKEVDRLSTFLVSKGFLAKGLHGDMEQRQREEVIKAFRKGSIEILIATDVAARGLDVNDVSHVFNYHIPFDSDSYVHRIGRTARAGKDGVAISIVTPHEFNSLLKIQKSVGSELETKVIPTIHDVQMKKKDALIKQIKEQNVSKIGVELVENLKDSLDIEKVAQKLASLLYSENDIEGSDKIGKNITEVNRLFQHLKKVKKSNKKPRSRKRGGKNFNHRKRRSDR